MTMAMASSAMLAPTSACPTPSREASMVPANAASAPVITYTLAVRSVTRSPESQPASWLPPMA
jgi:hypothetical protein